MKMRSCLINSRLLLSKSWKNEVKSCLISRVTHKVLVRTSFFTLANLHSSDRKMSERKYTV